MHTTTRAIALKLLGFVYLSAFLSAALEWKALAGTELSLTPARLNSALPNPLLELIGVGAWQWDLVAWGGMAMAAALILFDHSVYLLLIPLWIWQLALVNTTVSWIRGFGWEWQILETTTHMLFACLTKSPSTIAVMLLQWMAFRVMLGAGLSKLGAHASSCWRDLTCTTTHYLTQPFPNPLSLFMHNMPRSLHVFEVLMNHFVELVCPWFLLLPSWRWLRPARIAAATISILYMIALGVTGNYAFIQTITVVPLLMCLDDDFFTLLFRRRAETPDTESVKPQRFGLLRIVLVVAFAIFVAYSSIDPVRELCSEAPWIKNYSPYYWINSYGVFGFVNSRRLNTVLEQFNGTHWSPLDFRWGCLPGDNLARMPCVIAPLLHSRLQWSTWIYTTATLEGNPQRNQQFIPGFLVSAIRRLKQNDSVISPLFELPYGPPSKIRATLYEYFFNSNSEWWETGLWYTRIQMTEKVEIN